MKRFIILLSFTLSFQAFGDIENIGDVIIFQTELGTTDRVFDSGTEYVTKEVLIEVKHALNEGIAYKKATEICMSLSNGYNHGNALDMLSASNEMITLKTQSGQSFAAIESVKAICSFPLN